MDRGRIAEGTAGFAGNGGPLRGVSSTFVMPRPLIFLIATLALAQGDSVFRSTTQLIQIDVAAEDKNGQPVYGLGKDDFELIVNRKPQSVDTFTATTAAPVPVATLPRGTFSNKQTAVEVSQGRYTVFLLDWRNTNRMLQSWANLELPKMLAAQPPENKAALYLVNDNGFQILQEFTSDHELLLSKATSLWGEIPPPLVDIDQAEQAARETVLAFQGIAKHLAGISGQKLLIWISTGFPDNAPHPPHPPGIRVPVVPGNAASGTSFQMDIDNAVRVLGNANIVVESTESSYLGATVLPEFGSQTSYVNTLRQIAERTGGRFFPAETNDLAATLHAAATDRAASYEIGYYLSGDLPPGLQPFEVRCKRPGVVLRYREGYFVEKTKPKAPADNRAAAQDVLERAVDAVGIPLTARATRTMGNIGSIVLRLTIDAGALALQRDGDVWRGKVSVLTRFASEVDDQLGDVPLDSPSLILTAEQHDRAIKDGISLRFTMRVPAGAATLRAFVRDETSGNTGSVTIPLGDLPEF